MSRPQVVALIAAKRHAWDHGGRPQVRTPGCGGRPQLDVFSQQDAPRQADARALFKAPLPRDGSLSA
ncbi:MAG TPA: hypothetical protein VED85_04265, partial [Burkholderiaceae bacterium]|nr:hypothetical protein [Burkholderiaceae bacterium]